jgi:transportin-1
MQEDDDIINSWNLRKCSDTGLDILLTIFGDEILPILMPLVHVFLISCGMWNLCCCETPCHVTF